MKKKRLLRFTMAITFKLLPYHCFDIFFLTFFVNLTPGLPYTLQIYFVQRGRFECCKFLHKCFSLHSGK